VNIQEDLKAALRQGACFVGIGNELRRDDAAGVMVMDALQSEVKGDSYSFCRAEDVIENHVFRLCDSDAESIVLIDAVVMDEGAVVFGRIREMDTGSLGYSTHKLSLEMAAEILEREGKEVYLLGIAVNDITYGIGLTDRTREHVSLVRDLVLDTIH
jgi:hydrogenase 3 maturation protease